MLIVLYATLIEWLACESGGSAACDRKPLAETQLFVGWVAALALLGAGILQLRAKRRAAIGGLVLAAMLIIAWGVLADAAHHGWGDLKFFPF
jgi:hypothetical protein